MGKPLQYILEGGDINRGVRVITYGKCQKSPYVENGLWFVHVPRIDTTSTTFLVMEEYARLSVMDDFEIDLDRWSKIAQKIIPGSDWNSQEECLWRDMPFYIHILPDGTPVRYGLSRSQSKEYPNRELWYIIIGLGDDEQVNLHNYETFVVDKVCTEPEFMEKMGSDPKRWQQICWSHPVSDTPWHAHLEQVPDPYSIFKKDDVYS